MKGQSRLCALYTTGTEGKVPRRSQMLVSLFCLATLTAYASPVILQAEAAELKEPAAGHIETAPVKSVAKGNLKKQVREALSAPLKAQMDSVNNWVAPGSIDTPLINSEEAQLRAKDLLREGARLHKMGNDREAERLFGEAIATDPRNANGFFNLGALAEGRGDYVVALAHYRAGLNVRPNDDSLKEAVEAMEKQLTTRRTSISASSMLKESTQPGQSGGQACSQRSGATNEHDDSPPDAPPPVVDAPVSSEEPAPVVQASSPPLLNVSSPDQPKEYVYQPPVEPNGPFQLHSSQVDTANGAPLNAGTTDFYHPSHHRARTVAKAAGLTLGVVLSIGLQAALSSSMHCPRCRMLHF